MEADRAQAEQQITAILNRALKCVPLVKLDAVDECMKLFTEAVELMESSLELDDDDEQRPSSASSQSGASNAGSSAAAQSKLLSLSASTASTASNSSASSSDSEVDTRTGIVAPLQNKAIAGVAMTIDYSSPGSKTRSLGKQAAAPKGSDVSAGGSSRAGGGSTALGIGLKGTGGGGSTPSAGAAKPGVLGLHGAHKPSSRATASQNAMSGASSPHSGGGVSSPVSPASPDEETPEGIAAAAGGAIRPPTNKLVTKISGAPQSREYPSPKLGPRSLSVAQGGRATPPPAAGSAAANGTATPTPPANAAAAGLSLPMPDSLGRDAGTLPIAAGAASPDADDEGGPDDEDAGDLIRADKKNSVFNRVKGTLPVTASPKQIRSSFHLLELATSNSLLQQDQENADDLTMQRQGGGSNAAPLNGEAKPASSANSPVLSQASGVLSALPTGITTTGTGSTPKPAYLRRLDSPETHHGQLIAAKARLQMLINRGLQVADKVRMDKVPEIKAALEKALAKLEASLVTTTISHG